MAMSSNMESTLVSRPPLTQGLLERIHFWSPPFPRWAPAKKSKNSTLRFGCIVEERLARGLAFEGEALHLTPQNWQYIFRYAPPAFVLIESIWRAYTGHWHLAQCPASKEYRELEAMIEEARSRSIPVVFWMTKGPEYHEHYKKFAKLCDLVCCADPTVAALMRDEGIEAHLLPPCMQPALFNPFRYDSEPVDYSIKFLFDGWAALNCSPDHFSALRQILPLGLKIVDSRYTAFHPKVEEIPEYADAILGCLSYDELPGVLRRSGAYISIDNPMQSKVAQQWAALEAAGCRLPVVHLGEIDPDDVRHGCLQACSNPGEHHLECLRIIKDDLYRERTGHLAWRQATLHHSFAHRMRRICELLKISHDWDPFPKVSLITPTIRKHLLGRCLQTFEQMAYPNKELIVVFNGNEQPVLSDMGLEAPREDVLLLQVPGDLFAGATLNFGHLHASGEYLFRIDDDDIYAENYVLDMVLQARSIDAGLFGKHSVCVRFQDQPDIYVRKKRNTQNLLIVAQKMIADGKRSFAGNSIAGVDELFFKYSYPEFSYGSADQHLLKSLSPTENYVCAFMDKFNLIIERREDLSLHSWRCSMDVLMRNRVRMQDIQEWVL